MPYYCAYQASGAMNVGPAQLVQSEEDMIAPIRNFARLLTNEDYASLFALYPASDFDTDLHNYEAHKKPEDPNVSVHFFRVSRILRDLLFTCSSLKFGYEMTKQSRALNPGFDGVRTYSLNQTVYTPMLSMIGMPYAGVIHGSDQVYIFNGVFPEGAMTDHDMELAEQLSRNLINFATSGSPLANDGSDPSSWPVSFDAIGLGEDEILPPEISVQVIGGPLGTGPAKVTKALDLENNAFNLGQFWPDGLKLGSMQSRASKQRQELLRKEKLIERCTLIHKLSDNLGV